VRLWRISNYSDLSGPGGLKASGRWHEKGRHVVYTSDHPASALLEAMVHLEIDFEDLPDTYQLLEIDVPDDDGIAFVHGEVQLEVGAVRNEAGGHAHGGIIATLLDEIMVWACAVPTKRFAFCAELNVRFLNPLAPDVEALVTSELVANRKDRLFEAKAAIFDPAGKKLAEATGKYFPLKPTDAQEMVRDFVGDANWVLGK